MQDLAISAVEPAALIRQARQELAEAHDAIGRRRAMATAKLAADVARQSVRVAATPEAAREAIAAAIDAEALCLDAEVDSGRWLQDLLARGERPRGRPPKEFQVETLSELGVTRNESKRWQDVAAVEDGVREQYIKMVRQRQRQWVSRARLLRLWREILAERKRQEPVRMSQPGAPDIRPGDFRVVLTDVEPGSVDAIITDPPYPREFIPLFGDLGKFAARVLKPSGVLAAMCGQSYLFEYLGLLSKDLSYRWTGAYITQGPRTRMHEARVGTGWKPILLFQRADSQHVPFLLDDLFDSAGDDKRFHHWGQSEAGFARIVERLTTAGALVIDPFLGGGTTAIVCRDLERQFIGCDIDVAAVNTTQERLGSV